MSAAETPDDPLVDETIIDEVDESLVPDDEREIAPEPAPDEVPVDQDEPEHPPAEEPDPAPVYPDPGVEPATAGVDELSDDVTALDEDATPGALDDSSSVVESDLSETGVTRPESEGGTDEHPEHDAIDELPDDRDGRPDTA